jgi:hypothetical protein
MGTGYFPKKGDIVMTRDITLTVNDTPIVLDYFVAGYLDHVTGGILGSLKGVSEIKKVKLTIDKEGKVLVKLNNANLPLNYFVEEIVRSTVKGMIETLKGVEKDKPLKNLELNITR